MTTTRKRSHLGSSVGCTEDLHFLTGTNFEPGRSCPVAFRVSGHRIDELCSALPFEEPVCPIFTILISTVPLCAQGDTCTISVAPECPPVVPFGELLVQLEAQASQRCDCSGVPVRSKETASVARSSTKRTLRCLEDAD